MLDGNRYGGQVATQVAQHFPYILGEEEIEQLAHFILGLLRKRGQAHLDPEDGFIRSFVAQFLVEQVLHYPPMEVAS